MFKISPYYYNGHCFSLDMPKCVSEKGILELGTYHTMKSDIFIHHKDQFLSPNSRYYPLNIYCAISSPRFHRSRVTVDVGKFVKLSVNHEIVQLIGDKGASNCEPGFDNYDKCIYDTLFNMTIAELDCTVPWLPGDRCGVYTPQNEHTISYFLNFSFSHWPYVCKNELSRQAAFKIYQENRRNQLDVCPNTCQNTNVYFGPLVTGDRDIGDIDKVLIMNS